MEKSFTRLCRFISRKVQHLKVLTFLYLCPLAVNALAADNEYSGSAFVVAGSSGDYDGIPQATSIEAEASTDGWLKIFNSATTNISLKTYDVTGFINISNRSSAFTINGSGSVSSTNTAALQIYNTGNISVSNATFKGAEKETTIGYPPIPGGGGSPTVTQGLGGSGGYFHTATNITLRDTTFSGSDITSDLLYSIGTVGLEMYDSTNIIIRGETTLSGGDAKDLSGSISNLYSVGGIGLYAANTSLAITNGTFTGGDSGDVTAGGSVSALSRAGEALSLTNSSLVIKGGEYEGGTAGTATAANGLTSSQSAAALYLNDSVATLHSGTFTGGGSTNAIIMSNSDLTTLSGTYTGGLRALTSSGAVSRVTLHGGTFDSIRFDNHSTATNLFTAGTNLTVSAIEQYAGTVIVTNQSDDALNNTTIHEGSMHVIDSLYTLGNGGSFQLVSTNSSAYFENLTLAGQSTMDIGQGQLHLADSLRISENATLSIGLNASTNGTVYASQATFVSNSVLRLDFQGSTVAGRATNLLVVTSDLKVGTQAATSANFTNYVSVVETNMSVRTSFGEIQIADNDLYATLNTLTLAELWDAEGQLAPLANELDAINNTNMIGIIDNMSAASSAAAIEQTYFTVPNTFQVILQGQQAAVGQSLSRGSEFREMLTMAKVKKRRLPAQSAEATPTGAEGPSSYIGPIRGQEMHGWIKYYGNFYTRDSDTSTSPGYDATLHGGVIGIDKAFGNLLIGLSGGTGNYTIDSENNAESSTRAYHGALYTTYGTKRAYIEAGLAYGLYDIETQTASPFILKGDYNAELISGHIGGGYAFTFPEENLIVTPEAAISYALYQQEAYTESSSTAEARSFEAFDADSLRSSLGLNFATAKPLVYDTFSMKPELRLHWMHEMNPEPGTVQYQLENGANDYQLSYPTLDEEIYRAGIGFIFRNPDKKARNIMLRLDFDELFGKNFNSHNLSAKAIWSF